MGYFVINWCTRCFKYKVFEPMDICEEHPDSYIANDGAFREKEIKRKRQQYLRVQKLKRICK